MSSLITREIRQIYKAIEDTNRRLASMILNGPVAAIDGDRVQLELEPKDDRTGKPFLSPWVQVQEAATKDGATATHFPVAIGDPMRLLSPNGELGPQSFAIRDSYTDPAANPTDKKQQELVVAHAGASIRMEGGEIHFEAARVTHNGKNIGDTHKHRDVFPGAGISGVPI